MHSFKEKVLRGIAWSSVNVFVKNGLSLAIHIVLARLLVPEDFGVIGMISIFIQLSLRIQGAGLGESLIRGKRTNQEEYNFVFFYSIIVGVCLYLIFFMAAPWIAYFYSEPKLIGVTRLISLNLIIIPLSGINRILLVKELKFNKIAITEICASLLSGCIAVAMALAGYGLWSLVIQNVCLYFFSMILMVYFNRWLPSFSFHWKKSVKLFSFGSQLMIANFIEVGFKNLYNVIIGKQYSAAVLGLYMQGMKLQKIPSEAIGTVVKNVSFPAFALIQEDKAKYFRAFRETVRLLTFISFPLLTVLAVTADPLIPLLLSEKWKSAVPFFQILVIVGFMDPLKSLFVSLFKISGKAGLLIKTIIYTKLFFLAGILITFKISIMAMVLSQVAATGLELFCFARIGKEIQYSIKQFASDLSPNIILALILGGTILVVKQQTDYGEALSLILSYGISCICFIALAHLTGNPSFKKIKTEVHSRFK